MIVAMIAMRMVQAAVDEVVDMVAVRNRFVAAIGTVHMVVAVSDMIGQRRAFVRVLFADFDDMHVGMVFMGMMKVAVVQIVDVAVMLDRRVAAVGAVFVGMFLRAQMFVIGHAGVSFLIR